MITPSPVFRSQFSCFQLELKEEARGKHSKTGCCKTGYFCNILNSIRTQSSLYPPLSSFPGFMSHIGLKKWVLRYLLKFEFDCKSCFNFKLFSAFEEKVSQQAGTWKIFSSTIWQTEKRHKKLLKTARGVSTPLQLRDPEGSIEYDQESILHNLFSVS